MRKVVLLGDSISLDMYGGYGKRVAELLQDEFTVWQPMDNCRFAKYTYRSIHDWKDNIEGADIIHWNNGAWDAADLYGEGPLTDIDTYVSDMLRVLGMLKRFTPHIIFATTTPARTERKYCTNERIRQYNERIVPELVSRGVVVDDLYTVIEEDINSYIRSDDNVHLTEAGSIRAAKCVAEAIRAESKRF